MAGAKTAAKTKTEGQRERFTGSVKVRNTDEHERVFDIPVTRGGVSIGSLSLEPGETEILEVDPGEVAYLSVEETGGGS